MADPEMSIFAPQSLADIEERLELVNSSECWCRAEPHDNALHDLATHDVPWLLVEVRRLRARVVSVEMDRNAWEREAREYAFRAEQRTNEVTALHGTIDRMHAEKDGRPT